MEAVGAEAVVTAKGRGRAIDGRSSSRPRVGAGLEPEPSAAPEANDAAVLSDVAHEIRNQFHKLYYCAELLRSEVSDGATPGGDGELGIASEMLDRTLRTLEKLTNGALDYVRPMALDRVSMRVRDIGAALETVLRTEVSSEVQVRIGPTVADASVAIDPGRLSVALRAIAAHLLRRGADDTAEGALAVDLESAKRASAEVLELKFVAPCGGTPGGADRRGELIEWALAAKVMVAHGGGVERANGEAGELQCTLWLPVVEEDGNRRS